MEFFTLFFGQQETFYYSIPKTIYKANDLNNIKQRKTQK